MQAVESNIHVEPGARIEVEKLQSFHVIRIYDSKESTYSTFRLFIDNKLISSLIKQLIKANP
jgi:hypothetical protein